MFGLFGTKKKQKDPKELSVQKIADLDKQISGLEEKIAFLEAKKNGQLEIAKEKMKKGDKTGAKQALAKKGKFNEQIKQYDGAIMMMEEQKMMLENSVSLSDVLKTIDGANKQLKEQIKGYNVEDLDKMKDDLEDVKMQQEEVGNFFKEYNLEDNEELDEELEKLANEVAEEELPDTNKQQIEIEEKKEIVVEKSHNDAKQLEAFLD